MPELIIDEVCVNPATWDLWPDGQITVEDRVVAIRNTQDSENSLDGIVLDTGSQRVFYGGSLAANAAARFYNRIDYGVVLDSLPLTIRLTDKSTTPWTVLDEFHYSASAPDACWQRQEDGSWVQKAGPRSAGY